MWHLSFHVCHMLGVTVGAGRDSFPVMPVVLVQSWCACRNIQIIKSSPPGSPLCLPCSGDVATSELFWCFSKYFKSEDVKIWTCSACHLFMDLHGVWTRRTLEMSVLRCYVVTVGKQRPRERKWEGPPRGSQQSPPGRKGHLTLAPATKRREKWPKTVFITLSGTISLDGCGFFVSTFG